MYDQELADRVRLELAATPFTERKMFGGLAFMLNGNMAVGVVGDDLMVRTGRQRYEEALARPHARLMDFTGRASKTMVFVGPGGQSEEALAEWVDLGVATAMALPPK